MILYLHLGLGLNNIIFFDFSGRVIVIERATVNAKPFIYIKSLSLSLSLRRFIHFFLSLSLSLPLHQNIFMYIFFLSHFVLTTYFYLSDCLSPNLSLSLLTYLYLFFSTYLSRSLSFLQVVYSCPSYFSLFLWKIMGVTNLTKLL